MRTDPPPPRMGIVETADGSRTLFDPATGQTYHSHHGALQEAREVFLAASGVAERLAAGRDTRVLEVGLGTGLNLLACADAATTHGAGLHYRALERRPPAPDVLAALDHGRHLAHPELASAWVGARAALPDAPGPPRPWRIDEGTFGPGITVEVALGEAFAEKGTFTPPAEALLTPAWAHAIFHDAFSPAANPEAWRPHVLARLASVLAPGGALVTYTVAGAVRRALTAAGLDVRKRPGPLGGKRHTLVARAPDRGGSTQTQGIRP